MFKSTTIQQIPHILTLLSIKTQYSVDFSLQIIESNLSILEKFSLLLHCRLFTPNSSLFAWNFFRAGGLNFLCSFLSLALSNNDQFQLTPKENKEDLSDYKLDIQYSTIKTMFPETAMKLLGMICEEEPENSSIYLQFLRSIISLIKETFYIKTASKAAIIIVGKCNDPNCTMLAGYLLSEANQSNNQAVKEVFSEIEMREKQIAVELLENYQEQKKRNQKKELITFSNNIRRASNIDSESDGEWFDLQDYSN